MDTSTEMGPLVSDEQFQKVSGYIESGKSEGGEIVAGGKYDNSSGGHFVHPTVFAKTNHDMKLVKEEIFGHFVFVLNHFLMKILIKLLKQRIIHPLD